MEGLEDLKQNSEEQAKIDLYQNPDYVSLYRYENPNAPYDTSREGLVSVNEWVGSWFVDNMTDLETFAFSRNYGESGRFVVVRIKKDELDKYRVKNIPHPPDLDFDENEFIIPKEVAEKSRVEIPGIYKPEWHSLNIPVTGYAEARKYIKENLTDQSIIDRIKTQSK